MILKITKGGISTIQEVDLLSKNLYRIVSSGFIINTNRIDTVVQEVDFMEINNLSRFDELYGEVIIHALRHVNDQ